MGGTLQPENRIAHYRIIGPLGAGGMGEVYLAHDETLERDVALKVLPAEFTQSEIRIKRFILEAKSASSLSHPHIVTIYEIGHAVVQTGSESGSTHEVTASGDTAGGGEPVHYIAMELIKGRTVKDLIHQEKSSLKVMLGHLAQAAEGLSKAHDAGIVHRDLKPGNMMVTDDGYAKVLDFGLAKLTERTPTDDEMTSAPTEGGDLTGRGAVVGTAAYMSPEQVKGKGVDHRSDIFSFGCILYEAATRIRPFNAETEIDTMHKIVHDKPPALEELNPAVPAELRRVIRRCMAKNPEQRLQSIKDLAIELREIVDEFDTLSVSATSGSAASLPALAPRRSPLATLTMVAAVVIGVVGISFGIWSMFGKSETGQLAPHPFQSVRMTSLMSGSDTLDAKLSPDGRYLAYIKGPSGAWSLWVRQVATGSDVQILAPQAVPIRGVSFSPDGNYLYYLGRDPETPNYSALFEVPSLGGSPRKRGFDIDTPVNFSPDGTRFVFIRGVPPDKDLLVIREMETGQETVLATINSPEDLPFSEPAWSPDGSRIVVVVTSVENGFSARLVAFDVATGSREPVTESTSKFIGSISWLSDGSGIVATTPALPGGRSQIFVFSYPMADRYQVTNDLDGYRSVSVSGGNAAIAALRTSADSSLWTVPVEGGEALQITSRSSTNFISNVRALKTGMISFSAQKDRHVHLWTINPDGSGRIQITSLAGWLFSSGVLPDGRGLVFSHFDEADSTGHIWRVDLDGGNLKRLTNGAGESRAALSPDGRTVLFTSTDRPQELWQVDADGGEAEKFLDDYSGVARYSPDGRWLVYGDSVDIDGRSRTRFQVIPAEGGESVASFIPPGTYKDLEWTADSSSLTYIKTVDGVQNLWKQPREGGEPVPLTQFTEGRIFNHEHSYDGRRIAIHRVLGALQDLWLVEADGSTPVAITDFRSGRIFEFSWARDDRTLLITQGEVRSEVVLLNQASD